MKITFKSLKKVEVQRSFIDSLNQIIEVTKNRETIKIKQLIEILSGKGYPALLIIFSLPFCFPIQIPGFSTLFGILLGFMGFRIAFGKHLWWPEWLLEKNISSSRVELICKKTINLMKYVQKLLHPRLIFLSQNKYFHCFNGLLICILAFLLALPIPIPFTNLLSAIPIFCIGLGLLEDDGVVLLIGYALSIVAFILFFVLFLMGFEVVNGFFIPMVP